MPATTIRILVSTLVVMHLAVITVAMLGHRGASYLHDDLLSIVAPYTAFGNWRADTNRMPIASSNQLEEIVRVECHRRDTPDSEWLSLVPGEPSLVQAKRQASLSRQQRFEQQWLHQLSGLLVYENDEGAGRMLMAALKNGMHPSSNSMDKVRVTVAPRLSQQQYIEVREGDPSKLPEAYQPQIAYSAVVVDLGDGELSLLRQMEARRASRTLTPPKRPSSKGGAQP